MSGKVVAPGARTFAAYAATAGVSLMALAALNLLADRTGWAGLNTFRNYITQGKAS